MDMARQWKGRNGFNHGN